MRGPRSHGYDMLNEYIISTGVVGGCSCAVDSLSLSRRRQPKALLLFEYAGFDS